MNSASDDVTRLLVAWSDGDQAARVDWKFGEAGQWGVVSVDGLLLPSLPNARTAGKPHHGLEFFFLLEVEGRQV
jgi:hypothetical protein